MADRHDSEKTITTPQILARIEALETRADRIEMAAGISPAIDDPHPLGAPDGLMMGALRVEAGNRAEVASDESPRVEPDRVALKPWRVEPQPEREADGQLTLSRNGVIVARGPIEFLEGPILAAAPPAYQGPGARVVEACGAFTMGDLGGGRLISREVWEADGLTWVEAEDRAFYVLPSPGLRWVPEEDAPTLYCGGWLFRDERWSRDEASATSRLATLDYPHALHIPASLTEDGREGWAWREEETEEAEPESKSPRPEEEPDEEDEDAALDAKNVRDAVAEIRETLEVCERDGDSPEEIVHYIRQTMRRLDWCLGKGPLLPDDEEGDGPAAEMVIVGHQTHEEPPYDATLTIWHPERRVYRADDAPSIAAAVRTIADQMEADPEALRLRAKVKHMRTLRDQAEADLQREKERADRAESKITELRARILLLDPDHWHSSRPVIEALRKLAQPAKAEATAGRADQ